MEEWPKSEIRGPNTFLWGNIRRPKSEIGLTTDGHGFTRIFTTKGQSIEAYAGTRYEYLLQRSALSYQTGELR